MIGRRFVYKGLGLVAALAIAQLPLFSQEARGTLLGRVSDSTGAVIVNAKVEGWNTATGVITKATTNESGDYLLPYLIPGPYTITVEAPGFKTFKQTEINLRMDDHITVDASLTLGQASESVEVVASADLLDTSTSSMGQVMGTKMIQDLPLQNGNLYWSAVMSPGVVDTNTASGYVRPIDTGHPSSMSVDGALSGTNQYTIDGAPNMFGNVMAYSPPPGIVEEFKVVGSMFDASYGYFSGATINLSLKSGTNSLHGQAYYFNQEPGLGANLFFNNAKGQSKAVMRLQRWGAVVDGPIIIPKVVNGKNKLFFMFGYEGLKSFDPTPFGVSAVPTDSERSGNFSNLLALGSSYQLYDPYSRVPTTGGLYSLTALPGNIVPASQINPAAAGIAKLWDEPDLPGTSTGLSNYTMGLNSKDSYYDYVGRIDYNPTEKWRLYFRADNTSNPRPQDYRHNNAEGWTVTRGNTGGVVDSVYTVSPTFFIDARYSYNRFKVTYVPYSMGWNLSSLGFSSTYINQIEAVNPADIRLPAIVTSNYAALADQYNLGTQTDDTHDIAVNASRILRTHTLRFGFGYRVLRQDLNSLGPLSSPVTASSGGIFNFTTSGAWTTGPLNTSAAAPIGEDFAEFLYGLPTSGTYAIPATYAESTHTASLYVQDDWKVTSKLTLSPGLRWEVPSGLSERYNRTVAGFAGTTPNPIAAQAIANYAANPIAQIPASQFQVNGGLTFAGANGLPKALWATQKTDFMPRLGLAYSIDSKTVVRAGYGIFDVTVGVVSTSVNQTGFSQTTTMVPTVDNVHFVATLTNPFPNGFIPVSGASTGLSTGLGTSLTFFNPNLKTPYMERWQFAVQRSLPGQSVLEVSYVGNHALKQLLTRNYDAIPDQYLSTSPARDQTTINLLTGAVPNPFYPLLPGTGLSGTTVARSQLLERYPEFTGVSASSNQGFSFYNAMQVRYEKRFKTGLMMTVSYAWSKLIGGLDYLNAGDAMPERVISGSDRAQRLVITWVYALPFGHGQRWVHSTPGLSTFIGGWQLQGVYTKQSGPPLGFGDAIITCPLNQIPLSGSQRSVSEWFNTACFNRVSSQQLANNLITVSTLFSGIRGDGEYQFDLSLLKNTRLREGLNLEIRGEAYNALNSPQFSAPTTSPTSSAFGTVTTQFSTPRTIQLAAKLLF
ncbi:MAG: carboxypeptidase regulatory-like domain-containing protein [Bryobacteraceae bacterium]